MKNKLFYMGIILSIFVGSMVALGLCLERYLNCHPERMQQITDGLREAAVFENRQGIFPGIILLICTFIFWIVGVIAYKIVFLCARVKVNEHHLLIALGAGLTLSCLVSYLLIGKVSVVLVMLLSNFVEIAVIFASLFDEIRERMKACIIVRGILLIISILTLAGMAEKAGFLSCVFFCSCYNTPWR